MVYFDDMMRQLHLEIISVCHLSSLGQINESQSLFTYGQNESVNAFARPDFEPMFADNITWQNDTLKRVAEAQCGEDNDCLFDVASTNDLSVGVLTKDINFQLVNETNSLGKPILALHQEGFQPTFGSLQYPLFHMFRQLYLATFLF